MVWLNLLLLGFGFYLCAYTDGNSFLIGVLFLCYAYPGLMGNYRDFFLDTLYEDLLKQRQEKLATLGVGTSAYLAERAKHREHDAAEQARRIRNRKAAA